MGPDRDRPHGVRERCGPGGSWGREAVLLLTGALTIGLILSLLALGIFVSFRVFSFPDMTADGSITLGASVAASLMVAGVHPATATAAAFAAGAAAGVTTAFVHTRCKVHGLRKAACRRLAEAGCSANEVMAISGHATMKELVRYTAAADQARLARNAMAKAVIR